MNMKFTSLTFLIAAVAGISFSQAAYAGNNARFDYAPNEYALEAPTGHRGSRYAGPHNVVAPLAVAGVVPKMHGLDNDFVSRPAPPPPVPVVAAAPIARPSVSSQVNVPKTFSSLFNPVKSDPALVANAPGQLPAFGSPVKLPTPPTPKMPNLAHNTNTAIRLLTPQHRHPVAAIAAAPAFVMPTVKHQSGGFIAGANIPLSHATSTGSSASTAVSALLMHK